MALEEKNDKFYLKGIFNIQLKICSCIFFLSIMLKWEKNALKISNLTDYSDACTKYNLPGWSSRFRR